MTAKTFLPGEVLSAADVNEYLAAGYWRRINRVVVPSGSPVTSVSFAGISSAYRTFRVTVSTHMGASGYSLLIRLNNDSSVSNYGYQQTNSSSSTVSTSRGTTDGIYMALGSFHIVSEFTITKLAVGDRGRWIGHGSGTDGYATGLPSMAHYAGTWHNTSALINRIDVITPFETFYGTVALEGMSGF